MSLHAKIQKNCTCRFFKKSEKPHFGPILGLFRPKTTEQDFCQKVGSGTFFS